MLIFLFLFLYLSFKQRLVLICTLILVPRSSLSTIKDLEITMILITFISLPKSRLDLFITEAKFSHLLEMMTFGFSLVSLCVFLQHLTCTDDKLVIDLGGLHAAQSSSIDVDTLNLTVGTSYPFTIFHAERHTTQSNFNVKYYMYVEISNFLGLYFFGLVLPLL